MKGYCQTRNVDECSIQALLQKMRETTDCKPDEVFYNSLLDGYGKIGLWEQATAVLNDMVVAGISPTAYTLSVLVKVARRSKCDVQTVFDVVDAIAHTHCITLNIYVYTNLVLLSVDRQDWVRAIEVVQKLLQQGLRPHLRAYTCLLQGLATSCEHERAATVLRAALGMPGAEPSWLAAANGNGSQLMPDTPVPSQSVLEVLDGMMRRRSERDRAMHLFEDMRASGIQIDAKLRLRMATLLSDGSDQVRFQN